jgi:integrase
MRSACSIRARVALRRRKGQRLGATTLRNLLVELRSVLNWAVEQDLIKESVAKKVGLPAAEHVERPTLARTDAANVLRAASGTEIFHVVATAIATGYRRSELCALRWCDVDLDCRARSLFGARQR